MAVVAVVIAMVSREAVAVVVEAAEAAEVAATAGEAAVADATAAAAAAVRCAAVVAAADEAVVAAAIAAARHAVLAAAATGLPNTHPHRWTRRGPRRAIRCADCRRPSRTTSRSCSEIFPSTGHSNNERTRASASPYSTAFAVVR